MTRFCAGILLAAVPAVFGQEAPLTASATQPSPGTVLLKQQARFYYGGAGPQVSLPLSVAAGIWRRHSLSFTTAGNFSKSGYGLSDIALAWKWRVHSRDFSPLNTSRTATTVGLQIPSGTGGWGTGSFNPSVGFAHTSIIGRLGLGLNGECKFNTGSGARYNPTGTDSGRYALSLGGSALWRVFPASYGSGEKGALYAGAEAEFVQSGDGVSARIGPAAMYEAETWVLEAGWQFYPVNTGGMEAISGMGVVGLRLFF